MTQRRQQFTGVNDRWQDALVRVVVVENSKGVRKIRHVLPIEHDRIIEIRAALAVCSAFAAFSVKSPFLGAGVLQT